MILGKYNQKYNTPVITEIGYGRCDRGGIPQQGKWGKLAIFGTISILGVINILLIL